MPYDGVPEPVMTLADVEAAARTAHTAQRHRSSRASGVRVRGGDAELVAAVWTHDAIEDVPSGEWPAAGALTPRVKDVVRAVAERPDEEPRAYGKRISATPGALPVKAAGLAHHTGPRRPAALDEPAARRPTRKYATMRQHLGRTLGPLDG